MGFQVLGGYNVGSGSFSTFAQHFSEEEQ